MPFFLVAFGVQGLQIEILRKHSIQPHWQLENEVKPAQTFVTLTLWNSQARKLI